MHVAPIQWAATLLFGLAVIHTFLVKYFHQIARKYPEGSVKENFFSLLGEIEIVFGLWSAVLLVIFAILEGPQAAITYLETRNFQESAFVFVILTLCSTQPILDLANALVSGIARLLPMRGSVAFYATTLTVGPLLGSFITEPAAMTVTALLLLEHFYRKNSSVRFKYATIGVLFVNVSIGGALTPYDAPPVLMVATKWGWGLQHMLLNFGLKAALACFASTALVTFLHRKELSKIQFDRKASGGKFRKAPIWVQAFHLIFLGAIVMSVHHPILVIGLFLFFLGFINVTSEHQGPVQLKQALLVSFFLGGLVVIGGLQRWWLEPMLTNLSTLSLYLGAIGLTAFTDNAALTYLGSLVVSLSDSSRYALVAGSLVGGGLTVIANAPNPAGFSILQASFGEAGISPLRLLGAALVPTFIAAVCFWVL